MAMTKIILNNLHLTIYIEMDAFKYIIGEIFSQLTLDNLSQWYLVAFFSQKMIPTEIQYKAHNNKLLVIIKAFKTWKHNLKGYIYKVLVFTDPNKL